VVADHKIKCVYSPSLGDLSQDYFSACVIDEGTKITGDDTIIHEKKDAAELVLDGHLLGENPLEVNLHELLRIAQTEFKNIKTIDEYELEQDWPRQRAVLGQAFLKWKSETLGAHKIDHKRFAFMAPAISISLAITRQTSPQHTQLDAPNHYSHLVNSLHHFKLQNKPPNVP